MKKTLALVLSLILVVCMVVPATAATTEKYSVELGEKVDVLAGLPAYFVSPKASKSTAILTNAEYVADWTMKHGEKGTRVYLNEGAFSSADAALAAETSGATYQFAGVSTKYFYSIEVKEVACKRVDAFALYFTTEEPTEANGYSAPWTQIDSAFDILVSCDSGATYQVAWSSVDMVMSGSECIKAAGMEKANGGNATLVNVPNGSSAVNNGTLRSYRVISEKFNKTYENVTNIVYASKTLRRNKLSVHTAPAHYCARISEFDVYEAAPAPVTADTTVYFVAVAAVVAGAALTIAVRKKEN